MKKVEKYTLLVFIIILLTATISSFIYVSLTKNEQNKSQEITLKENELEKYLSYVPRSLEFKLYDKKATNLASISEKLLITKVLDNESSCWDKNTCSFDATLKLPLKNGQTFLYEVDYVDRYYLPFSFVKEKMLEYYNKNITNLSETKSLEEAYNTGMTFAYQDNYFLGLGGGETDDLFVNFISSYKATAKELIIYEYAAHYNYFEEKLSDYYNNYQVKLAYETDFNNYLKSHQNKFTEYKHTFKKNDTGYYWYSTEVV